METDDEALFRTFKGHYTAVSDAVAKIGKALYDRLSQDVQALPASPRTDGTNFVFGYVTGLRGTFCGESSTELAALRSARQFLEEPEHFEYLRQARPWRALWRATDSPTQRTFAALQKGAREFAGSVGGSANVRILRSTTAGYLFRPDGSESVLGWMKEGEFDKGISWMPIGHETECLMEFLAATWCGLLLLGTRSDSLWSKVLHLANDETNGLPSGVCIFKAYGDIYRHAIRELSDLDSLNPALVERENHRVRQVAFDPSLFGRADVSETQEMVTDLSPYAFRRIGALYYLLYQIAYLRTGRLVTYLWLFGSISEFLQRFDESAKRWLRFACAPPDPQVTALKDGSVRRAIWACERGVQSSMSACALGVRHGVMVFNANPAGLPTVPFGGRRVSADMFRSLVLTVRGLAEGMKPRLEQAATMTIPQEGAATQAFPQVFDLLAESYATTANVSVAQ